MWKKLRIILLIASLVPTINSRAAASASVSTAPHWPSVLRAGLPALPMRITPLNEDERRRAAHFKQEALRWESGIMKGYTIDMRKALLYFHFAAGFGQPSACHAIAGFCARGKHGMGKGADGTEPDPMLAAEYESHKDLWNRSPIRAMPAGEIAGMLVDRYPEQIAMFSADGVQTLADRVVESMLEGSRHRHPSRLLVVADKAEGEKAATGEHAPLLSESKR